MHTAGPINNLGLTYYSQGKYNDVIAHFERASKIFVKLFGVNNINVADKFNNLGITYRSLGRREEAKAQFERALGASFRKGHHAKQRLVQAYEILHNALGDD